MNKIIIKTTVLILIQALLIPNIAWAQKDIFAGNNLASAINVSSVNFQNNFQSAMDPKQRVMARTQESIFEYTSKKFKKSSLEKLKKKAFSLEKKAQESGDLYDWLEIAFINFAIGPSKYSKVIRIITKLEENPIFKPATNFLAAKICQARKEYNKIQHFATEALIGSIENDDDILATFAGAILVSLIRGQAKNKTALLMPKIYEYLRYVEEYVTLKNPTDENRHKFKVSLFTLQAVICVFNATKQFKRTVYVGDKLISIIDNKALDINNKVEKKMIDKMCFWLGTAYKELNEYEKAEYFLTKAFKITPEDFENSDALIQLAKKVKSQDIYKRILTLVDDALGDRESMYKCLLNEILFQEIEDIEKEKLQKNRKKFIELGQKEKIFQEFYPYLINFTAIDGQVQLARKYLVEAEEKIEDQFELDLCQAVVYFYEGNLEKARQILISLFNLNKLSKFVELYKYYRIEIDQFIAQMIQDNNLPENMRKNIGEFLFKIDPKLIEKICDEIIKDIKESIQKADYEQAEKLVYQGLNLKPEDKEMLSFNQAILINLEHLKDAEQALENNNWAQALESYEKYLELNPQEDPANYGLKELRKLQESLDIKQKFITQVNALIELAKRQENKAKFNSAYKNYQRLKELIASQGNLLADSVKLQKVGEEITLGLERNQGKSDRIAIRSERQANIKKATTAPALSLVEQVKQKKSQKKTIKKIKAKRIFFTKRAEDFYVTIPAGFKLLIENDLNKIARGQTRGKSLRSESFTGKRKTGKKFKFISFNVKSDFRLIYAMFKDRILVLSMDWRGDVYDKLYHLPVSTYEDLLALLNAAKEVKPRLQTINKINGNKLFTDSVLIKQAI
ncbi:MAG: hypothetical protein ABIG64_09450 [Candidatus Omnitrophota bacterium]